MANFVLEPIVFQILLDNGASAGTDFLLAPGLGVTCAHVIRAARKAPGDRITIQWYREDSLHTAQIYAEPYYAPETGDDAAFLKLDYVPEGATPLALGPSAGRQGQPFACLGFPPDRYYAADIAQGILGVPMLALTPGRADTLLFEGNEIRPGFSGAPVYDPQAQQIAGMVVEKGGNSAAEKAYAVTTETIARLSPQPLDIHPVPERLTLEKIFAILLDLLRQPDCSVRPFNGQYLVLGGGQALGLTSKQNGALSLLREGADGTRREALYLQQLILNQNHARWAEEYIPLSGTVHPPKMYLRDERDQNISSSGEPLKDIRQALVDRCKPKLSLLGDPGAGKTTILRRLALDLAHQRLADGKTAKLPFLVELSGFRGGDDPQEFLLREWNKPGGPGLDYREMVDSGQVCFLLDGLNQMPFDDRKRRYENWHKWTGKLSELVQVVFTCRRADYEEKLLLLPQVLVQTLNEDQIKEYLEKFWGSQQAEKKYREFKTRLAQGDARFEALLGNPLMLSLLVEYQKDLRSLTANRADLMRHLIENRLEKELCDSRHIDALLEEREQTSLWVQKALTDLAYAMQQCSGEGTQFDAGFARDVLAKNYPQWRTYLNLASCARLLTPTFAEKAPEEPLDGSESENTAYSFGHHLLQEYFAARSLLHRWKEKKAEFRLWWRAKWRRWEFWGNQKFGRGQSPRTGWEETTRMAAAACGQKDIAAFVEAVAAENLPLAGLCLAEARADTPGWEAQAKAMRQRLLERQRSPAADLRGRIPAGLALGELGHPDLLPEKTVFEGKETIFIRPAFEALSGGGRIGRYAVTNAEYRYFILAGGYDTPRWWRKAGWSWQQGKPMAHQSAMELYLKDLRYTDLDAVANFYKWPDKFIEEQKRICNLADANALRELSRRWERPFNRPAYWDDPNLSAPGLPVVGVNWYEAQAYCAWLSALCGETWQLPSEEDWLWAAQSDDLWAEKIAAGRVNTHESGLYRAVPVGTYPQGRSACGAWEMRGNIWEWTASGKNFQGRPVKVLRGGSWYSPMENSYKNDDPVNFYDKYGFRVLSHDR